MIIKFKTKITVREDIKETCTGGGMANWCNKIENKYRNS